jgi:hypothetical protein
MERSGIRVLRTGFVHAARIFNHSSTKSVPGRHGRVLALLTLIFSLRVSGQAIVEFLSVDGLPSSEAWASGLIPYSILLAIQLVMLVGMVKIVTDVWSEGGFFATAPASWSRFLIGCSAVYAASMAARYVLTMIFQPDMRWLGGTIPIFFHFVLAAFLYTWGKFLARQAIFARPDSAC